MNTGEFFNTNTRCDIVIGARTFPYWHGKYGNPDHGGGPDSSGKFCPFTIARDRDRQKQYYPNLGS